MNIGTLQTLYSPPITSLRDVPKLWGIFEFDEEQYYTFRRVFLGSWKRETRRWVASRNPEGGAICDVLNGRFDLVGDGKIPCHNCLGIKKVYRHSVSSLPDMILCPVCNGDCLVKPYSAPPEQLEFKWMDC